MRNPFAENPAFALAAPAQAGGASFDYGKYHGLGNDYLVIDPAAWRAPLTPEQVRALCDRQRGIGADGVLVGPLRGSAGGGRPAALADGVHALRIFNPDGGEAEKSGNGVRIFARCVWEQGLVAASPFSLHTAGGLVGVTMLAEDGSRMALDMGRIVFDSERIPMTGPPREVLGEPLEVGGRQLTIHAANIGNPHCVVFSDAPTPDLARELGSLIEHHPSFPERTNVQFVRALDRHAIRIEIWERGAGYTQASGTSSCAAAAVACRMGLCESPVTVHMPGGTLEIRIDAGGRVELEGEVSAVSHGRLADAFCKLHGLQRA